MRSTAFQPLPQNHGNVKIPRDRYHEHTYLQDEKTRKPALRVLVVDRVAETGAVVAEQGAEVADPS